jgi:hypothetical protein
LNLFPRLNVTAYRDWLLLVALIGATMFFPHRTAADDSITVYRWQSPDGTVEYSDEPRSGAEPVTVEEPMIQPSPRLPLKPQQQSTSEFSYRSLSITEPAAEATFRNSEADEITVIGSIEPALRNRDRVFLLVDGTVVAEAKSLSFKSGRLERGRHLLQLQIRADDGETIIQSDTVPINVHRTAVGSQAGGAN